MSGRPIDAEYLVPQVCRTVGISYRQLDYWDRTGLVKPSKRPAAGSGSARVYSFQDLVLLRVVKKCLDAGLSLQRVRPFLDHLRVSDDMRSSFVTDGKKIVPFTDLDMETVLVDIGPTWFAINVAVAWQEMERATTMGRLEAVKA